jgi:hypothetical protein
MPPEGPDDHISLGRAAELSGRSPETLRVQARAGKLRTVRRGRGHLTTRRWLHDYLMGAKQRDHGRFLRLPEGYVAPE